jgi:hypothetical protein
MKNGESKESKEGDVVFISEEDDPKEGDPKLYTSTKPYVPAIPFSLKT